jgi:hypothetical protein
LEAKILARIAESLMMIMVVVVVEINKVAVNHP